MPQSTNSNTLKQDAPRKGSDNNSSKEGSIGSALVQFMWAIYGIAGTLIYTSIMAVAVIELFVWVMLSVAVAAFSKCLGFFLCALVEKQSSKMTSPESSGLMETATNETKSHMTAYLSEVAQR
jgi:hypothetical protein